MSASTCASKSANVWIVFGLLIVMVPIAPAALYVFQRSAADPKCACSGPGIDRGVAEMWTTTAPFRSRPASSSMFSSGMRSP
ncbi:MAG: hypothetical protein AUI11_09820 [Acidobacteria bacterium 13_2_20CM_2_66_4]|nr:MAG: hypothetical protein AUI11_09820 [Acidobacteria bacterium 13_2_20CM_2_66_4]PYQ73372.1 MAG: hypothetical protein DMG01_22655 [Acidobacteriota bacterium]